MRGLADADIKTVVLGEVEQKANLDDLVRLIQAKEYAKSSTSGSSLSAISTKENVVKLCTNCNTEHEQGLQWRKLCPAQKKTCRKCGKLGHFEVVCRNQLLKKKVERSKKRKSQGKTNTVNEESSSSEGESTNAIDEELGLI